VQDGEEKTVLLDGGIGDREFPLFGICMYVHVPITLPQN
jgi:hypothetical protein